MLVDFRESESDVGEDEGAIVEVTKEESVADAVGVKMEDSVEGGMPLSEVGSPPTPSSKVYSM